MLAYRVNGHMVEVDLGRAYELHDLRTVLQAIRDDPAVPPGALLIVDGTKVDASAVSPFDAQMRAGALMDIMGERAARVFAVVVPTGLTDTARLAQHAVGARGLRMGIFQDIESARRWLSATAGGSAMTTRRRSPGRRSVR